MLRALAVAVAALLVSSHLAQIAHFLLIPHAICSDHGELVELSGKAEAAPQQVASNADQHAPAPPHDSTGHDHCELLASHQREATLPAVSALELVPAEVTHVIALTTGCATRQALPALALAPKTSPPRSRA